jgi:hypothetical protein
MTEDQFIADLAQAMGDPDFVFWSSDEHRRAFHEALLVWGAHTPYWTNTGTFTTVANTPFYDLSVKLPTLRPRAYTFDNLHTEIQYHILEPPMGVAGGGVGATDQFTLAQIDSALSGTRNEFVIDAKLPLTFGTFFAASNNTLTLDQSIAVIARAAWIDTATGIVTPLRRTDPYAAQAFSPLWNMNPGKPYAYSQAQAMPGTLTLVPPQRADGSVHLTYAQTLNLDSFTGTTTFAIPDEFAWAIKYGALGYMLGTHSPPYDPLRAKYCNARYDNAVEIAALHHSVIRVRINGKPVPLATVAELDDGKPFWQTGTGVPSVAAASYDLLSFYRVPSGSFTVSVDLVQAAPLPATGASFINIGRDEINYIYDYCRHILTWKMGGEEFVSTMPLYDSFLAGAAKRNSLIATKVRYLSSLFARADETDAQVA